MLEIKVAVSENVARSKSLVTDFSNGFTRFVCYSIACVLKAIKFTLYFITLQTVVVQSYCFARSHKLGFGYNLSFFVLSLFIKNKIKIQLLQ